MYSSSIVLSTLLCSYNLIRFDPVLTPPPRHPKLWVVGVPRPLTLSAASSGSKIKLFLYKNIKNKVQSHRTPHQGILWNNNDLVDYLCKVYTAEIKNPTRAGLAFATAATLQQCWGSNLKTGLQNLVVVMQPSFVPH